MIYYNKNKTQKFQNSGIIRSDDVLIDNEGDFTATQFLPEVSISGKSRYPLYNSLTAEQKRYWDHPVFGAAIKRQAMSGEGDSLAKDATSMTKGLLVDIPVGSMQVPQSLLVEGIEAVRGNEYDFNDASHPDQQRAPSDTFLKDAHPAVQFAGDMLIDPDLVAGAASLGHTIGKKAVKNLIKKVGKMQKSFRLHNLNPNAWEPNPNKYYRAGEGRGLLDDAIATKKIRAVNPESGNSFTKVFPESDAYFSKGKPLDGYRQSQYYGDHVIEVSDEVPFIAAVNQRTRQKGFASNPDKNYNKEHLLGQYVKPRQSYGYINGKLKTSAGTPLDVDDKVKLLRPHWWKRYVEVEKGFSKGGILYK